MVEMDSVPSRGPGGAKIINLDNYNLDFQKKPTFLQNHAKFSIFWGEKSRFLRLISHKSSKENEILIQD